MPIRNRRGVWHYRFYLDGREYTGTTDLAATERNRTAAMRREVKARELVLSGRAHELRIEVKPFNDAARDFLEWAKGEHREHENTARRLKVSCTSLQKFFGTKPVSTILRGDVNDFKSWRRIEHKVRDITIRHDLHALSKAYQYFIDHNWARENPVRGVEIPSDKDAVRMHVLTASEEMVYFEAAKRYPALFDIGRLMLNQGCRPEELLKVATNDINLEQSKLTIRSGKSWAARRILKLTSESRQICARRVMNATAAECSWLFPGKVAGTHLAKLNGRHDDILNALALCKCGHARQQHPKVGKCFCGCAEFIEASRLAFVIYDFRHTFATRAAEAGMPVATLAAILGHADLRSVMKYVHVRQEAEDLAMDRFDEHQNRLNRIGWSGFGPVDDTEKQENEGSRVTFRDRVNDRQIN